MTIYNNIGIGYNQTRKADPFIVTELLRLLKPEKELTYLDIGCGTGNYTTALRQQGVEIKGIDPSEIMLAEASAKDPDGCWTIGRAEALAFADQVFSGAIATLTIHHWPDLSGAFREIFRALKPASHLVIFTAAPQQMRRYWLCHYFPTMMEKSIQQMPSAEKIISLATDAGLRLLSQKPYFIADDLQDLFLYAGKNAPSLYLDEKIRHNISSFASFVDNQELEQGLNRLAADTKNGNFEAVAEHFRDNNGDYLFLQFFKPDQS